MPPPLLGIVGLVLWLNRIALCWMLPFQTESELNNASAVACAQVAADPVVVELVVVGTRTEGNTACTRRGGREQLITLGRVRRHRVVVHVHVQVEAVRQLSIGVIVAVLAGAGISEFTPPAR